MGRVRRVVSKSQSPAGPDAAARAGRHGGDCIIQALIPLGLRAVEERVRVEVAALAGPRFVREDGRPGIVRWSR